jgi:hypothetical protein
MFAADASFKIRIQALGVSRFMSPNKRISDVDPEVSSHQLSLLVQKDSKRESFVREFLLFEVQFDAFGLIALTNIFWNVSVILRLVLCDDFQRSLFNSLFSE